MASTVAFWPFLGRARADSGEQALVSTESDSGQRDLLESRDVRAARADWTMVLTEC